MVIAGGNNENVQGVGEPTGPDVRSRSLCCCRCYSPYHIIGDTVMFLCFPKIFLFVCPQNHD